MPVHAVCPPAAHGPAGYLRYPDPRLHTVARPVAEVDARIGRLVEDMLETMYASEGIGLAATQVDVHEQLIVIDVSRKRDQPLVLINPEITWRSDDKVMAEEGCLSVPAIYDAVQRHARVRACAGPQWPALRAAGGRVAVGCVQHEMDHLQGKVFVDYLSLLSAASSAERC